MKPNSLLRYPAQIVYSENSLGFSIGGWHPLRANTYLPTLKKLDPLAKTSIGKALWKPVEKLDRSVAKDFGKAKHWSQEHRKELQIAAAVALAAVGGAYALGYLGTTGAAAGAAGTAAAAGGTAATVGGTMATVAGGASVLGTTSSVLGVLGAAATLMGKLKGAQQAPQETPIAYDPWTSQLPGGGYQPGGPIFSGGGGSGLGPWSPTPDQPMPPPESTLPPWALPAAGGLMLYLLMR